ncbi:ABC transporter substrate-binding protein [Methyloceanibacter sp. wino2]|uniref:ABC transporter substrate-binding protein n=1 Tax=Methyloceanibacter sp. wino2 TaxID=2170729 RepID=UPI000D3E4D3B|nr:ABC transporter substrate-binding protein [Methyloceanibacter sp. wino2]
MRFGTATLCIAVAAISVALLTPAYPTEQPGNNVSKPSEESRAARKPPAPQPETVVDIVYLGKQYEEPIPLSLMEPVLTDKGVQGARLGILDNNATARFLGVETVLTEHIVPEDGDVTAEAKKLLADGPRLIVADLEPDDLLAVADLPEAQDSLILNMRSADDRLRQENCRANVVHIVPNWAMRADALAQYLVWKKWPRWLIVKGTSSQDDDYAEAVKRAAQRFGGKVVDERTYEFEAGSRRVESGHQQIQSQIPMVTQNAPDHDVVFVIDTGEAFGLYFMYRTSDPDPVVGTHGLTASIWHRAFEQWGGMSLQSAFQELAGRNMTERDYAGWLAVRTFGEAAARSKKRDVGSLRDYVYSDKFRVAGFKGQKLTVRPWDHQLRQPILIMGPQALVSLSPQEGFLHQHFPTDTLGFDEPETACRFPENTAPETTVQR